MTRDTTPAPKTRIMFMTRVTRLLSTVNPRQKHFLCICLGSAVAGQIPATKTLSKDIYFAVAPDRHGWVHHKGRLKRPLAECPISSSD